MEFGDLFSKSWEEYKKNFWLFFKIFLILSLIPGVIFSIVALIVGGLMILGSGTISGSVVKITSTFFSGGFIFLILIGIIVFILDFIMGISFIYVSVYSKKNIGFGQAVKGALGYFWDYTLLGLLFIIFLIPLFLLLIIPGIIFSIYWAFSPYVLIKENVGPWEAMKRSKAIVKGKWWRTFGYLILMTILMWLISILFKFPQFIYKLILDVSSTATLNAGVIVGFFIVGIISFLSNLITTPLSILFIKNFYLDLRTKK